MRVRLDLYTLAKNVDGLRKFCGSFFHLTCLIFSQAEPVVRIAGKFYVFCILWELSDKLFINADGLPIHFLALRHVAVQFMSYGHDGIHPCQTFLVPIIAGESAQEFDRLFFEPGPQLRNIRMLVILLVLYRHEKLDDTYARGFEIPLR